MSDTHKSPEAEKKREFKVGDKVQWTHVTQNGTRMNFKNREGKVAVIHPHGATCKVRNGRTEFVYFSDMTFQDEPSKLTAIFSELAAAVAKDTAL